MTWTTPKEIKDQVQRLWDRGLLLAPFAGGESVFPRRLTFKAPDSRELSERFPEVRDWMSRLSAAAGPYRIEWRCINHRVLGPNEIPTAIWIDTLEGALGLIGKLRAAERFAALVETTRDEQSSLIPWMEKHPLRALALVDDWVHLLAIVAWLQRHPRPALYLRQVDLPGVHSKLIEKHRGVLAELLDRVLPDDAIDATYTGKSGFCRRYGFLEKPARVRFRVLDSTFRIFPSVACQDLTLTQTAFASLDVPLSKVFITENEINFLAFPPVPHGMVIFGSGYGFGHLVEASWLRKKALFYWGDIDTHGFAILHQLREFFPHAVSLLMDEQTLLAHRSLWGVEPQPETGSLSRLTEDERALYEHLQKNHWRDRVRLEQERIGFDFLQEVLQRL